jgi:urease accessory protein
VGNITIIMTMTELQSLIRLQTWLSPAFPTGSFSYSHGLEAAIAKQRITEKADLRVWLHDLMKEGPGWNDAVLLAASWHVSEDEAELGRLSELASAMSFSQTRHLETTAQGEAFLLAASAWASPSGLPRNCPLPVAVGAVSGKLSVSLEQTLAAYLHAYLSNQVQAAMRLMRLGQQQGVELLAALEEDIIETARRASWSTLDNLGSNTFMADISAMQHETLPSRIFRS